MIPKIIHYCWLSDNPVPDNLVNYVNGWKDVLKDYCFIKWDTLKFDVSSSVWVKEAFENNKYAFAADYIRLFAVYNMGGIYLDMDVEVVKCFDPLLSNEYMFAYENPNDKWIEAGCFGAEKNNPFIGECLERYNNRHFISGDGGFDQTTLPRIMSNVYESNDYNFPLYPWTYFTAKSFDTGIEYPTEDTYAIHHFAGSWKDERQREIIADTQKFSRICGTYMARNIAEYKSAIKNKDVLELTVKKLRRKFKIRKNQ